MSCKIETLNGSQSVLGAKLQDALGSEKLAINFYEKFRGDDFKQNVFGGNWELNLTLPIDKKDEELMSRSEPNGEPKLHKEKNSNQYYFYDKNNNKWHINKIKFPDMQSHESEEVAQYLLSQFTKTGGVKSLNALKDYEKLDGIIAASVAQSIQTYRETVRASGDAELMSELMPIADLIESYKEDFRIELINKVEALGYTHVEQEMNEEDFTNEDLSSEKKEGRVNLKESFQNNTKNKAKANIKRLLSQLNETLIDSNGEREVIYGEYLKMPLFVTSDKVFEVLFPLLSDIVSHGHGQHVVDVFDIMKEKISALKEVKGWAHDLHEKMEGFNKLKNGDDMKAEFVQAFSNTKLNLYVTETSKGGIYKVINATETGSRESVILNTWGYTFQNEYISGGKLTNEGRADLAELLADVTQNQKLWAAKVKEANKIKDQEEKVAALKEVYNFEMTELLSIMYGMGVTGEYEIDPGDVTMMVNLNGGDPKRFQQVNDLFNAVKYTLDHTLDVKTKFFNDSGFINPFMQETAFKRFANAVNMRDNSGTEFSVLANGGKTYYPFTNPSYLSNKINLWKADRAELVAMSTKIDKANSRWIKYLLGTDISGRSEKAQLKLSRVRIEKFKSTMATSFTSRGKNDGVDNVDIKTNDQINDNITKMLSGRIRGRKPLFPSIIAADKSRRIEFEGFETFTSGIFTDSNGNVIIGNKSIDVMLDYFTDEYNRMKLAHDELRDFDENDLVENYHVGEKNAFKSQIFEGFSWDSKDERYKEVIAILYDENGKPFGDSSSYGLSKDQKDVLREYIRQDLIDRFKETKEKLSTLKNVDSSILRSYNVSGKENQMDFLAGDYLMNGLISSIEFTKLFSGDPAYYKTIEDMIKRVPGTYSDGLPLRLTGSDELYFNQATVYNVELASRYVSNIRKGLKDKSLADAYEKVDTTDAQAWITPKRWKFLKVGLGQWGSYENKIYQKMKDGKKLEPNEMKLVAQPLKGVYFDINENRPVYLKYSQVILIPALVKGTPMQALLNAMTLDSNGKELAGKDQVHEVVTMSGIKVGSKKGTKINEKNGMIDSISLNPTKLSNRGWKLQQDLPIKNTKATVVGSQIQKNILDGLDMSLKYSSGKTGAEMMRTVHDLTSQLSDIGKQELSEELGIVDGKITNKSKIVLDLIQELKRSGGNENVISALEKGTPFDAIPQVRRRVESIFFSSLNKKLIKIETNGGSFIQVSPFGLETISKDVRSGIKIISKNYNNEALLPPRVSADGKTTLAGQAMMPMSHVKKLLDKIDKNIDDFTNAELLNLLSKDAINIISYRIPNQALSSNDALEIVGILPDGVGDAIIAYDGMPAKTGADFDIDKLFVMSNHLIYNENTKKIEVLTKENSKYSTKSEKEITKMLVQNSLVKSYQDILLSVENYDNLMRSVDSGNVKNDILSLHKKEDPENMKMFTPIEQLNIKNSYMSGKFGVAQTANQLSDSIYSQSIGMYLDTYIGHGKSTTIQTENGSKKVSLFDQRLEGTSISVILSEFLTAYVDVAKDPFISRGNHNSKTANVTFMLIRAGVDFKMVNRFIGQPILFDLVKLMEDSEGITSDPLRIKGMSVSPIEFLRNQQNLETLGAKRRHTAFRDMNSTSLELGIKDGQKGIRNKENDGLVLDAFEHLLKKSKSFSEAVLASKSDTMGITGSVSTMMLFSNKIDKVISDGIIGNFEKKFKRTMLGTYRNNTLGWAKDVISNSNMFMMSNEDVYSAFNDMSHTMGKAKIMLSPDAMRVANNDIYTYLVSGFGLFKSNRTSFKQLFSTLPTQVFNMKTNGTKNFFLKQLEISDPGENNLKFISLTSTEKSTDYQNRMYRGWMDLYINEETREMAINLVKYSFSQSGFQNNLTQFFTHIPHEILKEEGFSEFLGDRALTRNLDSDRFVDQSLRHNSNNPKIVPILNHGALIQINGISTNSGFKVSQTRAEKLGYKSKEGIRNFPKFVSILREEGDSMLFEYRGEVDNGEDNTPSPIYTRTHKLGYKKGNKTLSEFDSLNDITESNIPSNNVLKIDKINGNKIVTFVNSVGITAEAEVLKTQSDESDFDDRVLDNVTGLEDFIVENKSVMNLSDDERFDIIKAGYLSVEEAGSILEKLGKIHGISIKQKKFDDKNKVLTLGSYNKSLHTIFLNSDFLTLSTYLHELAHPFVTMMNSYNPNLFNKLYAEVEAAGLGIDSLPDVYSPNPISWRKEEAIVRAIEQEFSLEDMMNLKEDSLIKKLMAFIKEFFGIESDVDFDGIMTIENLYDHILSNKSISLDQSMVDKIARRDLEDVNKERQSEIDKIYKRISIIQNTLLDLHNGKIKTMSYDFEGVDIEIELDQESIKDIFEQHEKRIQRLLDHIDSIENKMSQSIGDIRKNMNRYYSIVETNPLTTKELMGFINEVKEENNIIEDENSDC